MARKLFSWAKDKSRSVNDIRNIESEDDQSSDTPYDESYQKFLAAQQLDLGNLFMNDFPLTKDQQHPNVNSTYQALHFAGEVLNNPVDETLLKTAADKISRAYERLTKTKNETHNKEELPLKNIEIASDQRTETQQIINSQSLLDQRNQMNSLNFNNVIAKNTALLPGKGLGSNIDPQTPRTGINQGILRTPYFTPNAYDFPPRPSEQDFSHKYNSAASQGFSLSPSKTGIPETNLETPLIGLESNQNFFRGISNAKQMTGDQLTNSGTNPNLGFIFPPGFGPPGFPNGWNPMGNNNYNDPNPNRNSNSNPPPGPSGNKNNPYLKSNTTMAAPNNSQNPATIMSFYQALNTIPYYDGNPDTLRAFCKIVRDVVNAYGEWCERWVLNSLSAKLRGRAAIGYAAMVPDYDSVETFLAELVSQYGSAGDADSVREELKNITQRPGESPGDYGLRVQTLLNRLITIYDSAQSLQGHERETYKLKAHKDALDYFLYGLQDPPEYRVSNLNPDCLRTAIAAAVAVGHRTRGRRYDNSAYNAPGTAPWPMPNAMTSPGFPTAQVNYQNSTPKNLPSDENFSTIVSQAAAYLAAQHIQDTVNVRATETTEICTYCQAKNHKETECRRKEYDNKFCEFCRRPGHTFDKCFALVDKMKKGELSLERLNRTNNSGASQPPRNFDAPMQQRQFNNNNNNRQNDYTPRNNDNRRRDDGFENRNYGNSRDSRNYGNTRNYNQDARFDSRGGGNDGNRAYNNQNFNNNRDNYRPNYRDDRNFNPGNADRNRDRRNSFSREFPSSNGQNLNSQGARRQPMMSSDNQRRN